MEMMVRTFSEHYNKVSVVCEFGNHGRLGRKGELPAHDNIDAMAYRIAQDRTRDVKNVTWQMSNDWYQIVTVGSYKALLVHGDEIKSFGGNTPAFGILRKANAWATGVVEDFQDVYMGHWHTPMALTMANGGRVFVTGSPESHNEYAREFIAAVGKPSQRVHFIDPSRGRVTAEYVVWLD
jgi:predicted phosphodiesterase